VAGQAVSGYLLSGAAATRAFVVTPYVARPCGVLEAEVPREGVCRTAGGPACRIAVHHYRERVTGPCFPLTVVRCAVHGRAFTLYPPGHVPYGRRAVALVAPDGGEVVPAEASRGADPVAAWSGTVFQAAVDAAFGRAWPRDGEGGPGAPSWRTQRRHLARGARLLGVEPDLDETTRGQVARELGVVLLALRAGADRLRVRPGYRALGEAQLGVLLKLPASPATPRRLLVTGHLTRLWGPPHAWEPGLRALRRLPFRPFPTGPPAGG